MKDTLRKLALLTLSACLTFPAVAAYNPRTVTLKARSESMAAAGADFAGDIVAPENEKVTFRITHNGSAGIYDKVEITVAKKNGSGAEVEYFHHAETAVDSSAMPDFEWDTSTADPELSDGSAGEVPECGAYTAYAKFYKDGTDPLKYSRTTTQCKVHLGPKLEILQVPEFLFANAGYATTIKWEVEGVQNDFAQSEDLSKVSIGFCTDASNELFNKDFMGQTVGVEEDGTLSALPDYTGTTFETYIGPGEYTGIDLECDRTGENNAYFFVTTDWDGDYTCSIESDENETVRYFMDKDVPVIDIPASTLMSGEKTFPESAFFSQAPTLRTDAIADYVDLVGWDVLYTYEPAEYIEENGDIFWPEMRQPKYTVVGSEFIGDMFTAVIMTPGIKKSRTAIVLPEDTIGANAGTGGYRPIVCAKNLGTRSGIGSYFSYGPKDDDDGMITDILNGGKAMDYDRQGAEVEFYHFKGDVEVNVSTKSDDMFGNALNSASDTMVSFFTDLIPYSDVIGVAQDIFEAIDSAAETSVTSAGEALVGSYWSRIDPDGSGEDGETVRNPLSTSTGDAGWSVSKTGISVKVGQHFSVYTDLSTRFQQRSEGYYDLWGWIDPPDLSAEIELVLEQDWEPYYKIKRD